jgi:AcrR family transcriptional regulator
MNDVHKAENQGMAGKREDLKRRLVEAAEARIAADGLAALRARDVTADAGCALGGLYTAYEDLDMLVLAVGSNTLARLGMALEAATARPAPPAAQLEALALAYLDFALANQNLWSALFDHVIVGREVPDQHHAENAALLEHVIGPLAKLQPGLGEAELALRARTYFSAVHGIVRLSLEDRFAAAKPHELASEISIFVRQITAGMVADSGAT